jgi:hypothetical protein
MRKFRLRSQSEGMKRALITAFGGDNLYLLS